MYSGTPLDIKKFIVLLHTLSTYNSLLVRYKVYSSPRKECLCTQPEGMVKSMKTLILIQHHVERNLLKDRIVIPNCQSLLLRENYTEKIA